MLKWYWFHCKRACGLLKLRRPPPPKEHLLEVWSFAIFQLGVFVVLLLAVAIDLLIQLVF